MALCECSLCQSPYPVFKWRRHGNASVGRCGSLPRCLASPDDDWKMPETSIGSLSLVKWRVLWAKGQTPQSLSIAGKTMIMSEIDSCRMFPVVTLLLRFFPLDVSGRHVRIGSVSLMLAGETRLIVVRSSKPCLVVVMWLCITLCLSQLNTLNFPHMT